MQNDVNIFVRSGLLNPEFANQIKKIAEKDFDGDVFLAMLANDISEEKILEILSKEYNIPYVIKDPGDITDEALSYVTEISAKEYNFIPLGVSNGAIEIGVVNPDYPGLRDAIRFISETKNVAYKIFIISPKLYKAVINRYGGVGNIADSAFKKESEDDKAEDGEDLLDTISQDTAPVDVSATEEDSPMRKVLSTIIRDAISDHASDIHIENTGESVKVRYRVDGSLQTKTTLPAKAASSLLAIVKLNAKLLLDEHRKPQDGGFSVVYQNRKVDLRISTLPAYYGEKIVIRILDTAQGVLKLTDIGMGQDHLNIMKEAIKRPYGLILITGPTGSGKSTTLYAMLSELDKETQNIVSLEDPVEYHVEGITQSQVHPAIGYTFAAGLRSILRQDPNVIMVQEIRDKETAQLAIQAALTGHLVLATLHTNNAVGAIPRLIDMGVDPYLIAPTLILSVAQRLTKTFANDNTKKEIPVDESLKEIYTNSIKDLPDSVRNNLPAPTKIYEPAPNKDFPTGLQGRLPVMEMFQIDSEMQSLILSNPKEDAIYKLARDKGMLTMKEDAFTKAFAGKIPIKEVYSL